MVRVAGKQLALFQTPRGIKVCDNRCPHEGYPLVEGSLSNECILTCNWHNWKFDLDSGENLLGGDRLRTYPVELREGQVWVDIATPPFPERYRAVTDNLHDAFDEYSYDRMAREIARLIRIGGDPLDALVLSIEWSWQRMEFGWTHTFAGMADWLSLYDELDGDPESQLICLVESVAHAAFDVLREKEYPFTSDSVAFDAEGFERAVENEDEATAIAMARGGLADGMRFDDFEPALTRAALAHYNNFGHSLIYVTKAARLTERLASRVCKPLLLSLIRNLIYATREDRVPEFRAYPSALVKWRQGGDTRPEAGLWRRRGIESSIEATLSCSRADPQRIYRALLQANAINLLSFDIEQQYKTRTPVSGNVGWLDFTHGITFANAVRKQCSRFPELWPRGLLQMACFNGRNAAYTTPDYDLQRWAFEDPNDGIEDLLQQVLDHGLGEHIVSVHWLKTALAVREEMRILSKDEGQLLAAALHRFMHSPLRRRQARRTAYQSLKFIENE